jgi:hypothetical protein
MIPGTDLLGDHFRDAARTPANLEYLRWAFVAADHLAGHCVSQRLGTGGNGTSALKVSCGGLYKNAVSFYMHIKDTESAV